MSAPASPYLYILGLLYLDGDLTHTPVLTRSQLQAVGRRFADAIYPDMKVGLDGDETYLKFRLSEGRNPLAYDELLGNGMRSLVSEVQFGYYHHRAIFRLSFTGDTALPAIRDARVRACELIRERCFDRLTGCVIPGAVEHRIEYVYSYSLLVIPCGHDEIEREREQVREAEYDRIFTVRSTTFGLYLPQRDAFLRQRRHYVRISVPSTVVYADGPVVDGNLLDNLIDAIYYGGLYQKAKADHAPDAPDGEAGASDRWTNDLLLSVFNILVESVRANERDDLGLHVARISAVAALVAVLVTVVLAAFAV